MRKCPVRMQKIVCYRKELGSLLFPNFKDEVGFELVPKAKRSQLKKYRDSSLRQKKSKPVECAHWVVSQLFFFFFCIK